MCCLLRRCLLSCSIGQKVKRQLSIGYCTALRRGMTDGESCARVCGACELSQP